MSQLDKILSKYVQTGTGNNGSLLGAAFIVKGKNGKTLSSNAAGKLNFESGSPSFTVDSVCWIASMTKLLTAVAVMQVVEEGLISLDDDVRKVVPRFSNPDLLKGFDDDGKPIIDKLDHPITLRHLLTHSSGLGYDVFDPELVKWSTAIGRSISSNSFSLEALDVPLKFQPGEGWVYGIGVDWAGHVIETLAHSSLEEYMRRHIFDPLDMSSTTFRIADRSDLDDRRAAIAFRSEPNGALSPGESPKPDVVSQDYGGVGLYSTANDYAKLLGALVSGGGSVLKPESIRQLHSPQLRDNSHLMANFNSAWRPAFCPEYPAGLEADYGLGGAINLEDIPSKRRKGSLMWSGLTNGHWWFDPRSGIAAVLCISLLPAGDGVIASLYDELETAVYKALA